MADDRSDRLSIDKHYEMLTHLCRDRHRQVMDGIKLFAALYVAIAGGSMGLAVSNPERVLPWYGKLADIVMFLAFVVGALIVWENHRAWRGYRRRITKLAVRQ